MKIVTAEEAVSYIKDGDVVATGGFTTTNLPWELLHALRDRFIKIGKPRDLTFIGPAGQSGGKGVGFDAVGIEGLAKRLIMSHSGKAPQISDLIMNNKVLCYCFPQGVISQMFRDITAKRPYLITHTGLGTFVDPRVEGGKVNEITKKAEDMVELVKYGGGEYLRYKTVPVNFALIRGTTSDEKGNISMEKEGVTLENLSIAQATRTCGGIVVVQVERVIKGLLPSREVKIPGIFVDYVVVATKPEYTWQTVRIAYDPAIAGVTRTPPSAAEPKPLDERKIIGRRAAMELGEGAMVNLGIGMATEVANVAMEENIYEKFTLTVESGVIGGIPLSALDFGCGVNYEALIDQPYQFDFYQGGGLDLAFLGLAQADEDGNINVSKFGGRFAGCGGFIDITQNAKKVVFCGTLTTKGLEVGVEGGKLKILQEGSIKKFVKRVEQITFSGEYARKHGQEVLYVTERAVFRLGKEGMVLEEIAPGIDLKKDVLAQIEFSPIPSKDLKLMDEKIFKKEKMGLQPKK
ncbi:MAG: malonate decarboxylase subunit alpha [Hadesarchaea archaeon]|nr:malonate decarboxylase subunit alpha [Hadesarchaea archaeon]